MRKAEYARLTSKEKMEKISADMALYYQRRSAWLIKNGPCKKCGTTEKLEIDHIDPSKKTAKINWFWKTDRREAELSKCQVLCSACHKEKTYTVDLLGQSRGEKNYKAKLTNKKVLEIRKLYARGVSVGKLVKKFGVDRTNIHRAATKRSWAHL